MRGALAALLGLAALGAAAPAHACRLALALGLDVSASVDAREDVLQRQGLAAALLSEPVNDALFGSGEPPVAMAVFEWSGRSNQSLLMGWRLIETEEDLLGAATAVAESERVPGQFPTSIGAALGYAAILLGESPSCTRRVIDLSGDGVHNDSYPPASAYRGFPLEGVTVNGLVIEGGTTGEEEDEDDLYAHYLREVIRGPGAFVMSANGFEDFERAMTFKLERELRALALGALEPGEAGPG
ncbi:DUF1194 domain-containing protein [Pseudoroseicyclus tamaricis]|uniref:DUF1194 domain-containing protein n=1 Tax=Pseudoroseicyclus tamaricis TaxID=2705421 RepID=A0A6B2JIZ8_9RHOB|nr:DUF1194 domain-containing protein [Pseudoroseicyclus tamaricis]NDV01383.1 DUF1194 domain-containing protein [Pseudoroseicyclus tamaricis]